MEGKPQASKQSPTDHILILICSYIPDVPFYPIEKINPLLKISILRLGLSQGIQVVITAQYVTYTVNYNPSFRSKDSLDNILHTNKNNIYMLHKINLDK